MMFRKRSHPLLLAFIIIAITPLYGYGFQLLRTYPDPDADPPIDPVVFKGWPEAEVPYCIVLGKTPSGIGFEDWVVAVRKSFNSWSNIQESGIDLQYQGLISLDYPNNMLSYYTTRIFYWDEGQGPTYDTGVTPAVACIDNWSATNTSDYALAVCKYVYSSTYHYLLATDIFVNCDPMIGIEWCIGAEEWKFDVQSTLTHEIGHFIGLGHTDNEDATMYYAGWPGDTSAAELHEDDINGAIYLYPRELSYVTGSTALTPDTTYTGERDTVTGLWPGEESFPVYGPEPNYGTPGSDSIEDPLSASGGGGGGGCTVAKSPTHAGGTMAPFAVLALFLFVYTRREKVRSYSVISC